MTSKAPFLADNVSLNLLNTIVASRGQTVECIPDGESLLHWLVAGGVLTQVESDALKRRFGIAEIDLLASHTRRLRESFRVALEQRKVGDGDLVLDSLVQQLNLILSKDARYLAVELFNGTTHVCSRRVWENAEQVLSVLAENIALLFNRNDLGLIKKCANPSCVLWFEDKTRAHRRQYCSSRACGNRAKVAAFRLRKNVASPIDGS
ncbi:CGNR zinc finger domain-containing protein [Duganella callida]|uniref:Zf-CGNR multi-domain protein n=1 Tax=Duganella callida TaxID=2561932 RepID=A0A4Y9S9T1_9BURK|nr:CGNR zinc finger domain-containing protein [Duganella callida]TFW18650.1 zf-CGNR multi-domain protein [Duganella callida]